MPSNPTRLLSALLLAGLVYAPSVAAQDPISSVVTDTAAVDSTAFVRPVSPTGAFLRSIVVPGWGQAAVGSYNRAGFYFGVEATSLYMILKTQKTIGSARTALDRTEAEATARYAELGITDPEELATALDEDEDVTGARDLLGVREQQREDWIAFGVFMLLVGGADAFVAAHLADFPEALEPGIGVGPGGSVEVGFSLRLPNF